jgi:hypothetical protein
LGEVKVMVPKHLEGDARDILAAGEFTEGGDVEGKT